MQQFQVVVSAARRFKFRVDRKPETDEEISKYVLPAMDKWCPTSVTRSAGKGFLVYRPGGVLDLVLDMHCTLSMPMMALDWSAIGDKVNALGFDALPLAQDKPCSWIVEGILAVREEKHERPTKKTGRG